MMFAWGKNCQNKKVWLNKAQFNITPKLCWNFVGLGLRGIINSFRDNSTISRKKIALMVQMLQ